MAKVQYLERIFFLKVAWDSWDLDLTDWDPNCHGLTSGSEVMGNAYKSIEWNWWQQNSSIEHRYRYHLLALKISGHLVKNCAGLDFLKFQPTPCLCLPTVHCDIWTISVKTINCDPAPRVRVELNSVLVKCIASIKCTHRLLVQSMWVLTAGQSYNYFFFKLVEF